jgi:phosphoglycerate kinase
MKMSKIKSLKDIDLKEKKVLLRLDINAPIDPETHKIVDVTRLEKSLPTLQSLLKQNAAIAIIAHQGDTLDYQNLISMCEHAELLTQMLGTKVSYVEDVCGPAAIQAVKGLKPGQIVLLGNLRYLTEEVSTFENAVKLSPEDMKETWLVRSLTPLFDAYVNDAFSAAHRNSPSMVAFQQLLPSVAGELFFKEYSALSKILHAPDHPSVFLLGGAKISDAFGMIEQVLKNNTADTILTTGVLGQVFLIAHGVSLGEATVSFLESRNLLHFIDDAKKYLAEYEERVLMPVDLAYRKHDLRVEVSLSDLPIDNASFMDIGHKTVDNYVKHIADAKTIFVNGPPGVYEDDMFSYGTSMLWNAVADASGYSVMGGGDSVSSAHRFIDPSDIDYICTAGGAMVRFMTGKTLPLIRAMEEAGG